jgi:hypothetical protein
MSTMVAAEFHQLGQLMAECCLEQGINLERVEIVPVATAHTCVTTVPSSCSSSPSEVTKKLRSDTLTDTSGG